MPSADLLLHPVRLRIVQALLGDRARTTGELRDDLPDVPPATLYRHVALLADAEVLEVVDERRVRGAVERTYRLREVAVAYRQAALHLSDEEMVELLQDVSAVLLPRLDNQPAPGRTRRMLTTIVMSREDL